MKRKSTAKPSKEIALFCCDTIEEYLKPEL
jgi:hypothetical protein